MPAREQRIGEARRILTDIGVQELPFPPDAAARLARLRAATRLKMPDCCVLLAAEHAQARVASLDDKLNEAATSLGL
jgi:hypothetical protein